MPKSVSDWYTALGCLEKRPTLQTLYPSPASPASTVEPLRGSIGFYKGSFKGIYKGS